MTRCDVANDSSDGRGLAARDVEVGDGEKSGRVEEAFDAVEEGEIVGHHTAKADPSVRAWKESGGRVYESEYDIVTKSRPAPSSMPLSDQVGRVKDVAS